MIDPHTNPSNWKLGIFYFNPEDKRIFVPKRIAAFGITPNFANKYAILIGLGIFILVLTFALNTTR